MAKVVFNKLIDSFSGKIGSLIFYEADGQTLSRTAPAVTPPRSAKQQANSQRFLAAQDYAAKAMADPVLKAAYKALCRGHQNARNLSIRDAMHPPRVEAVELEAYAGKPGQVIRVQATDDFRVVEVKLSIYTADGAWIEAGLAHLETDETTWSYAAQVEVPTGQTVSVVAVAKDNPGNTAECQRWHLLKA